MKDSTHVESLICLTVSLSLLERFTNKLQIIEVRGAYAHLLLGCALYSLQHVNIQLVSDIAEMSCFYACKSTNGWKRLFLIWVF